MFVHRRHRTNMSITAAVAEALESRRLLSTAYIVDRTLYVDGTSGNDGFRLEADATEVFASGTRFARSAVDRIVVRGFGGNDWFEAYHEDGDVAHIPTTLAGGDGVDDFYFYATTARNVSVQGGGGDDEVFTDIYDPAPFRFGFDGGTGTDRVGGFRGTIDLRLYPNVENGWVSDGYLYGNELDNDLYRDKSGWVWGFGGDDTITADGGDLYADAGAGDDTVVAESIGRITVIGGTGNDEMVIASGSHLGTVLNGGDGNDTLRGGGGGGRNTLIGGDGNDLLASDPDADPAAGDSMLGGSGNDRLAGGIRADTLDGGDGNDTLDGGLGADLLKGGLGTGDVLDYSARTTAVSVKLGTTADDGASGERDNAWSDLEQVWGGAGNDFILGSGSANVLRGNAGSDTLLGGGGSDALFGGSGNDRLDGMSSNDYLEGGTGNDTLIGGSGADMLKGQDGNDELRARDDTRDTLDGGSGTDRGQRDSGVDYVTRVEVFFT
jgi:Ca2+-binding RTX toxin-like protein